MTAKIINEVKISTLMETVKTEKRYFWPSFQILIDLAFLTLSAQALLKQRTNALVFAYLIQLV